MSDFETMTRTRSSAVRYARTMTPYQADVEAALADLDDRDRIPARATALPTKGGVTPVQSVSSKPIRRDTSDDQAIDTSKAPSLLRRRIMRKGLTLLAVAAGSGVTGALLVEWAGASWQTLQESLQEGQTAAVSVSLVCGHGDSQAHPTELHAYVAQDRLHMLELPAGQASKGHLFVSSPLSVLFPPSALTHLFVRIEPEAVSTTTYQVRVELSTARQWFATAGPAVWLFVDKGRGYFEPALGK